MSTLPTGMRQSPSRVLIIFYIGVPFSVPSKTLDFKGIRHDIEKLQSVGLLKNEDVEKWVSYLGELKKTGEACVTCLDIMSAMGKTSVSVRDSEVQKSEKIKEKTKLETRLSEHYENGMYSL